ncbi:uncharacterized protein ATC70_012226 [Mucor velutinosus]|uniref:BZIP domain-containing protein n=1 Tax=Mucor velutinosus TaxID=708070 RepID=A0AAN7D541_9FUNG|nr:hypothetical protein ATC70_012226 [Mucor velutinosus]
MKKSSDAIVIYHQDDSDQNESDCRSSPDISIEVEKAIDQSTSPKSPPTPQPIKLTSKGAIQLTSSPNNAPSNATTNAILNLKINPFFHDKRKWDDSFTVAEKKELTGNIVKAARDNDGETYVTLQEEEYTIPKSSNQDEEDDSQESDDVDALNKRPGRKPMADEESLSDPDQDPKVKRKAQNRAAQRAFRERKERYVKELEIKIKQVQDAHLVATAQLVRENQQLRAIIYRLESENYALKGIPMQSYQSQAPPSVHQPPPRTTSNSNNSNSPYANIAPLLPQTPNQQPLLLPAYLSNSPTPMSSILHPTSSSVNQMMMLASSPMQQYPMSPVVSAAIQSTSPTPSAKSISKKVSSKQNKSTPPPPPTNNQPLEYTFSISTPASLRPNGGASSSSSSSSKHNRSEPVELVQLYPPGGNHRPNNSSSNTESSLKKSDLVMLSPGNSQSNNSAKKAASVTSVSSSGSLSNATVPLTSATTPSSLTNGYHDDASSIMSDKTSSTVNTQQQRRKMQQLEIDMFDCHIDTEGQLFCEKLYNEVCNDAFDRLLSEPLFDQMGKLNLSISSYPVPIVTGPMSFEEQQRIKGKKQDGSTEETHATTEKDADTSVRADNASSPAPTTTPTSTMPSTKPAASSSSNTSAHQNQQNQVRLLNCPEIWFILNQHDKFSNFTTDQLCQAVKELAKCADSGPVLEESDLFNILTRMDHGHL